MKLGYQKLLFKMGVKVWGKYVATVFIIFRVRPVPSNSATLWFFKFNSGQSRLLVSDNIAPHDGRVFQVVPLPSCNHCWLSWDKHPCSYDFAFLWSCKPVTCLGKKKRSSKSFQSWWWLFALLQLISGHEAGDRGKNRTLSTFTAICVHLHIESLGHLFILSVYLSLLMSFSLLSL